MDYQRDGAVMSGALSMLLGSGGATVQIPAGSVTDSGIGGAQATISFQSDGDVTATTLSSGTVDAGDWIIPKSAAPGSYTIRADIVSGAVDDGTTGSDLALTSNQSWSVISNSGEEQCVLTISIKLGSTVLKSREVTLTATAT